MNSTKKSDTVLIAYVPTPHAGYLKFFRAYRGSVLYVLGSYFIREFQSLVRNLPGIRSEEAQRMIHAMGMFSEVRILYPQELDWIRKFHIVMPDEDVSHAVAEKYFSDKAVTFDGRWRLRWDWGATQKKQRPEDENVVSVKEFDRECIRTASLIAERSPDWWRQIGALLVKDKHILIAAFNRHVPSEQSEYCYGDPRSNFEQGQCIDVSSALHAEAGIVAEAVRRGISMEGCDLYVTTFPCPPCAYLCSFTGIKRLYYADGYSLVAGAETLQAKGVEIIRVEM